MSLSDRDRRSLQDLVEFVDTGARLVARGRKAYDEDEMLRLAADPQVRWRGMKGMRNVVAHAYGVIDRSIMWNSLENDLPREAAEVRKILER